jgi:hypothetical protein
MRAKDFVVKKRDPNWQTLQAKRTSGAAGSHKDSKRSEKQGDVKHKKDLIPMEEVEPTYGKSPEELGGADAWYHRPYNPAKYGFEKGSSEAQAYAKGFKDYDEGPSGGKQW